MNIELKITLWALACAYAIGNSFIYSWAFWSAFDINILQFASVTDILPSILYTIAIPSIAVIISFAIAELWERLKKKFKDTFESAISKKIKYYEDIKYYAILTFNISSIIVFTFLTYKLHKEKNNSEPFPIDIYLQAGIPALVCMLAVLVIFHKTNLFDNLKIPRKFAIFIFCFIPTVCYIWGYISSQQILNGKNTLLVKSDGQCKSEPTTQYRYISSISDKAFAMSLKDGSICIFKYNFLSLIPESNSKKLHPLKTAPDSVAKVSH
ncbi:hypothetical protein AB6G44_03015 [Enterobacter hormaechei]